MAPSRPGFLAPFVNCYHHGAQLGKGDDDPCPDHRRSGHRGCSGGCSQCRRCLVRLVGGFVKNGHDDRAAGERMQRRVCRDRHRRCRAAACSDIPLALREGLASKRLTIRRSSASPSLRTRPESRGHDQRHVQVPLQVAQPNHPYRNHQRSCCSRGETSAAVRCGWAYRAGRTPHDPGSGAGMGEAATRSGKAYGRVHRGDDDSERKRLEARKENRPAKFNAPVCACLGAAVPGGSHGTLQQLRCSHTSMPDL